ncbi:hypothetical protein [Pseudodesulfovibrio tunisiensis]|uniref:hypothetical protein n=1 Tax=Pseudodesulfovibrio tunisiensis TaxID=463192 RepID=UPI001FB2208B|nr:hypothetical protein [Pseudodesulfovibrio tunisiensis]
MARISLLSGADALKAVDDLHGKRIQAEAAVVARYARPGERPAELWVSRAASATEARRQTGLMVHMMFDNPKSPFSDPGRLEHAGIPIYRFSGMGQVHLIWYRDDLAYWVSCNPDDASAFLKAVCR